MKFLCQGESTFKHLKVRAGENISFPPRPACLLHQILKAAPGLISFAFPSQWESSNGRITPFDPSGTQVIQSSNSGRSGFRVHEWTREDIKTFVEDIRRTFGNLFSSLQT
ncbi:hypothetical protein F4814DRAFT_409076 [Daldinia grandis]|nr:hypothetical protein F4814DRAFT_409076 [Daldinia grandis]